jgi:hypothetical protein
VPYPYTEMTDEDIELNRVSGDITLVLKHGTDEEKRSLLTAIELTAGIEHRLRLEEWMADGMPGA